MTHYPGFSRVMSRPADRVRRFSNKLSRTQWVLARRCCKSHGTGRAGSGQEIFKSHGTGRVGSGQEVFKSHGTGRVGSGQEVFKSHGTGRVGSGRVRRFLNLAGRDGLLRPHLTHVTPRKLHKDNTFPFLESPLVGTSEPRRSLRCDPDSTFFFSSHFYFPDSGQAVVTRVVPSHPRVLDFKFLSRIGFSNPIARLFFIEC